MTTFSPGFELEALELRRLLAADLVSDAVGLYATESVTVNGTAYFFADDGIAGRELWKNDGSAGGTALVKDLTPGNAGTKSLALFEVGERLVILTVKDEVIEDGYSRANYTLWSSDGTDAGTVALAEFTGAGAVMTRQVGEQVALFVSRRSPVGSGQLHDGLLYFTDGTSSGTRLVKTFLAGIGSQGDERTIYVPAIYTLGDRIILPMSFDEIWSSDGTSAGTIDLTPHIFPSGDLVGDFSTIVVSEDRLVIPDPHEKKVWITDGTIQGTHSRDVNFDGSIESHTSALVGDKYYFVTVKPSPDGQDIHKTLFAHDLETGQTTVAYEPTGDASNDWIGLAVIGDRLFVSHTTTAQGEQARIGIIDGDGFTELAAIPTPNWIWTTGQPALLNGVLYFVLDRVGDAEQQPDGSLEHHYELWRSDGTPQGTGMVRTLHEGFMPGMRIVLSPVNGKLVIASTPNIPVPAQVIDGLQYYYHRDGETSTTVYDPQELALGRQGATARLVNGVLRIGGSLDDDNIRLWRSVRKPDRLVVEYNGNSRSFPFSDVAKIIVDLQAGDDRFEIVEAEGGAIRARTSVLGGDGTDTILTGTGRDTVVGGSGGDLIRTRGNADLVVGGGGRDRINAGNGDDQVAGGTGNDQVLGGAGVDVLFGQTAIEMAFGWDVEGEESLEDLMLRAT